MSWKHNVRDDFPASIQHQVAVPIPHQSDGEAETAREEERQKDKQKEGVLKHRGEKKRDRFTVKSRKTERDK